MAFRVDRTRGLLGPVDVLKTGSDGAICQCDGRASDPGLADLLANYH